MPRLVAVRHGYTEMGGASLVYGKEMSDSTGPPCPGWLLSDTVAQSWVPTLWSKSGKAWL